MTEITPEELEDLRDTERAYDEICKFVVGSKMVSPLPAIANWKRDSERLQWLLDVGGPASLDHAQCADDARADIDEQMKTFPK